MTDQLPPSTESPAAETVDSSQPSPDPVVLTVEGFGRAEFIWQQDRFVQRFVDGDIETGHSIERIADEMEEWPASPPLQQLSLQLIGHQNVGLGVGDAGLSHWSISVEPVDDGRAGLKFDLACRCKTSPLWLGSTYQLGDSLELIALGDSRLDRQTSGISVRPSEQPDSTHRWTYLIVKRDDN